jgi:glycyl-tRNA synthetase beta chain
MATFLLEVGTEELPASFVTEALSQWRSRIPDSLRDQFLTADAVEVYGTPRRLAVLIRGLPDRQSDREEDIKGPAAQAAFKDGKPTKAAEGFARSRNVSVEALEVRSTDKGDFVFVQQKIPGRPTPEILVELAHEWIVKLEGKRFMRWGRGEFRFSRPIRWLVALLDETVLPLTLTNSGVVECVSDRLSRGHRVLHPEPVTISHAEAYQEALKSAFVVVDPAQRKETIQTQTEVAASVMGGVAAISPALLDEVTNLVEYPTAIVGKFAPEFLELPAEVIVTVMESHQRYFPVLKSKGSTELLPYFITVSNGDPAKSEIIAAGNERVIVARLTDGKFFFDSDRAHPLEDYLPRLESVTFQESLGSVRAKADRIVAISDRVAAQLQIRDADLHHIQRAALLCKADLVTQMVGEFPELQGAMGQTYAIASGEPEAVATAIYEHYLPRGANDALPQTLIGQVVGIADRLDTLVSIFSLGMIPTGSSDPFALRRAANAILNVTWAANLPLNLSNLLTEIVPDDRADLLEQLRDFFLQRVRTLLQEEQEVDYDLVNAVLGEDDPEYAERAIADLLDVRNRALFLQSIRQDQTLAQIYETVNRASRLAKQGDLNTTQLDPATVVQPKLFQKPTENAFYDALVKLVPQTQAARAERNYQTLVDGLAQIAGTVSQFFDGEQSVMVMDENLDIRRNRLNLLGLLRNHARVLADFGAIVKE